MVFQNISPYSPGSSTVDGWITTPLLIKIQGLLQRYIKRETSKTNSFQNIDSDVEVMFPVIKSILFWGGTTVLINTLIKNRIYVHVNKKEIKEVEDLKRALHKTHTKEQENLWNEIVRIQSEKLSFVNSIISAFFYAGEEIPPSNVLSSLLASSIEAKSLSRRKWEAIKIRHYEDSLDTNQQIIYKNIFETEYKIMASDKKLTSLLSYGIPQVIASSLEGKNNDNIKKWENFLN